MITCLTKKTVHMSGYFQHNLIDIFKSDIEVSKLAWPIKNALNGDWYNPLETNRCLSFCFKRELFIFGTL